MKTAARVVFAPAAAAVLLAGVVAPAAYWALEGGLAAHARAVQYALIEEGGGTAEPLGAALLDRFERRLESQVNRGEAFALETLRDLDAGARRVVVFDFEGRLINADWAEPEIAALLPPAQIDRRRSLKLLEDEPAFLEDNYARYVLGKDPAPVRAYFRIYDTLGWVAGYGVVQHTAAARLEHARWEMAQTLRWRLLIGGAAFAAAGLIAIAGTALYAWRRVARPMAELTAAALGNAAAIPAAGRGRSGEADRVRAAAAAARAQLESLETALDRERAARASAEEERDRWRSDFERQLTEREAALRARMEQRLADDRHALLRRVTRALRRLVTEAPDAASPSLDAWARWAQATALDTAPAGVDAWLEAAVAAAPGPGGRRAALNAASRADAEIDPAALDAALRCLLDNAWQAAASRPDGRVSVDSAAAGGDVEIRVIDNGPGIGEAERADLFVALHSTRPDGAGLGLAAAQRIVELHGGRLTLHTEPGKGAVFVIALPRIGAPDS